MLDAKIKGQGHDEEEEVQPDRSNVIDLMAALKKSLGEAQPVAAAAEPPQTKKARAAEAARKQPALKLPIKGGKADAAAAKQTPAEESPVKRPRKRA